jgi:glycosyltransferase involved in cell wall biosynthesis
MKISIITVCFNSSETIAQTLRSVREQTHNDIEHIVIDGKSTDNTLEIVAAQGQHVAKLVSEKDSGIYEAMNKGIQLATGDVVAFLNADDCYKSSGVLERVATVMQAEQLEAYYGDVEFFRSDLQDRVVRRYNSGLFTVDRLSWGIMPAHPALFVRKELFDRFGNFRTDYKICGDFEFVARIFRQKNLRQRYSPEVLVRMRMGGVSTSGWRATLQINNEKMRACRENSIPTSWLKMLRRFPLKALEFFRT